MAVPRIITSQDELLAKRLRDLPKRSQLNRNATFRISIPSNPTVEFESQSVQGEINADGSQAGKMESDKQHDPQDLSESSVESQSKFAQRLVRRVELEDTLDSDFSDDFAELLGSDIERLLMEVARKLEVWARVRIDCVMEESENEMASDDENLATHWEADINYSIESVASSIEGSRDESLMEDFNRVVRCEDECSYENEDHLRSTSETLGEEIDFGSSETIDIGCEDRLISNLQEIIGDSSDDIGKY